MGPVDNNQTQPKFQTPQGTEIYKYITDLQDWAYEKWDKISKKARINIAEPMIKTLWQMTGDYSMSFVQKNVDMRIAYLDRVKVNYYEVEVMVGKLVKYHEVTKGEAGELAKVKLSPLIRMLNGMRKAIIEQTKPRGSAGQGLR